MERRRVAAELLSTAWWAYTACLMFGALLAVACNCGSSSTPADARGDAARPDRALPDLGNDGPADTSWRGELCGGSRTLTPVPYPSKPPPPTACGPGCRQVVLSTVENNFELEGDLLVSFIQSNVGFLVIYTRISSGESWRIHLGFPADFDGCLIPASNGASIYYQCHRGATADGTLPPVELLASFDPTTNRETDLACFPPQTPGLIVGTGGYLAAGSTGLVINRALDPKVCNGVDAVFHRFGTTGFENLSQHCGAVFYTHMAGPYAVWTEGNKDTSADNVVVYDTRTGTKTFVSPSPKAQIMPRTDGRYVVWADSRNDPKSSFYSWSNTDIYRYDIQTGKVDLVSNNSAQQVFPDVSGKWVVWEDSRNDPTTITPGAGLAFNIDIYAKNMETGQEVQLTKIPGDLATGRGLEQRPRVDVGRVVYRAPDDNNHLGLFLVDLDAFLAARGKP